MKLYVPIEFPVSKANFREATRDEIEYNEIVQKLISEAERKGYESCQRNFDTNFDTNYDPWNS